MQWMLKLYIFLNGHLEKEIYIWNNQRALNNKAKKKKVYKLYKLIKALCDLKQTPKQGHEKFDSVFVKWFLYQ